MTYSVLKVPLNPNQPTSSTCPLNMVNFGPLMAVIDLGVWGPPANLTGFRVLAALLHGTLVVGVSQTACWTGRHLYLAGRPSRWALAHILVVKLFVLEFGAIFTSMNWILSYLALSLTLYHYSRGTSLGQFWDVGQWSGTHWPKWSDSCFFLPFVFGLRIIANNVRH